MKIALFVVLVIALLFLVSYLFGSGKKKKGLLKTEDAFPAKWKQLLEEHVEFYKKLSETSKVKFEKKMKLFLEHHNIQGYDTDVDDLMIVMVSASAIIPTFHFENWDYPKLGTILIYGDKVSERSTYDDSHKFTVSGEVSNDSFGDGVLKISKNELVQGFDNKTSKQNVGIHEFTHLLDAADGEVDGEPDAFINSKWIKLWSKKIHEEIEKIKEGDTKDINAYGATSEAEFFAVISEYFFKRPQLLERKHPQLYNLLNQFFTRKNEAKQQEKEQV